MKQELVSIDEIANVNVFTTTYRTCREASAFAH